MISCLSANDFFFAEYLIDEFLILKCSLVTFDSRTLTPDLKIVAIPYDLVVVPTRVGC